jgi:hypothetical protein
MSVLTAWRLTRGTDNLSRVNRVEEHALGAGVVGTLVLDPDALCRVGEIQPHGAPPDIVQHRELNLGHRETARYQDQSQAGLHRGARSPVGQRDSPPQVPAAPCPRTTLRHGENVGGVEAADVRQGVDPDDGVDKAGPSPEVVRGRTPEVT